MLILYSEEDSVACGMAWCHGTDLGCASCPQNKDVAACNWYWPSGKSAASAASLFEHLHIECPSDIGVTTSHNTFLTPRTVPQHDTSELMSSCHLQHLVIGIGLLVSRLLAQPPYLSIFTSNALLMLELQPHTTLF